MCVSNVKASYSYTESFDALRMEIRLNWMINALRKSDAVKTKLQWLVRILG